MRNTGIRQNSQAMLSLVTESSIGQGTSGQRQRSVQEDAEHHREASPRIQVMASVALRSAGR
jgi:hypothetical protein